MLGSSHLCAESAHEYVCVSVREQTSHLTRLHVKVKSLTHALTALGGIRYLPLNSNRGKMSRCRRNKTQH